MKESANRANNLTVKWEDFYVDFSKNRITQETIDLFVEFANEVDLKDAIEKHILTEILLMKPKVEPFYIQL